MNTEKGGAAQGKEHKFQPKCFSCEAASVLPVSWAYSLNRPQTGSDLPPDLSGPVVAHLIPFVLYHRTGSEVWHPTCKQSARMEKKLRVSHRALAPSSVSFALAQQHTHTQTRAVRRGVGKCLFEFLLTVSH